MNTGDLGNTLPTLFGELVDGASQSEAYMLNRGDADWTGSWRKTRVSAVQWKQLRDELANEAHRWLDVLQKPRDVGQTDLNGVVASVAHFAYHVGAIRQIDLSARGPSVHD